MKLLIQIPCFNEAEVLAQTIAELPRRLEGVDVIEVLVIDDGSSDATAAIARAAGAHHVVQLARHHGLARAFAAGLEAALSLEADLIVNTDADRQYRGADIAQLIAPLRRHDADVVIGVRDLAAQPHWSWHKRIWQRFGSAGVSLIAGVAITDVTSGFRAYNRRAATSLTFFSNFTHTIETIIQAPGKHLVIQTVPIKTNPPTRPSRLFRSDREYITRTLASLLGMTLTYQPLRSLLFVGGLSSLIGLLIGSRFVIHYIEHGGAGHVQSLILAAVLLIIGAQSILAGVVLNFLKNQRTFNETLLTRLQTKKNCNHDEMY